MFKTLRNRTSFLPLKLFLTSSGLRKTTSMKSLLRTRCETQRANATRKTKDRIASLKTAYSITRSPPALQDLGAQALHAGRERLEGGIGS